MEKVMLILSRLPGEEIVIADDITIKVIDVQRGSGRVRLGISAPRDVDIDRKEVREQTDADFRESRFTQDTPPQ